MRRLVRPAVKREPPATGLKSWRCSLKAKSDRCLVSKVTVVKNNLLQGDHCSQGYKKFSVRPSGQIFRGRQPLCRKFKFDSFVNCCHLFNILRYSDRSVNRKERRHDVYTGHAQASPFK